MYLGLERKVVVITGGAGGIGMAMARDFLSEGARVVLVGRTVKTLEDAVRNLAKDFTTDDICFIRADCSDQEEVESVISAVTTRWGAIDVVVANVGDGRGSHDALPSAVDFNDSWITNFKTAEVTARVCIQPLLDSRGSLLFISSIAGVESTGAPTSYSIAKSAVIVLAKQLARKLGPEIRVNCIAPGNVLFDGGSWSEKIRIDKKGVESMINSSVPLRRFGTAQEVSAVAVFLCSSKASFVTGACVTVDGGQTTSF